MAAKDAINHFLDNDIASSVSDNTASPDAEFTAENSHNKYAESP